MAQFQWQFDAPSGVFKSHALSRKLYEAAIENSVFVEHADPVDSFGRGRGETITYTLMSDTGEPTDAGLLEDQRIPEDSLTLTTQSITVGEIGRSIPYTSLANDLSEFNLDNPIQRQLRNQIERVLDTKCATAFKATKIKWSIDGLASYTVATDGTFDTTSAANMTVYQVEEIRDYLADTLFAPMVNGNYVGIFRTLGLRGIKRDPDWEEWHKYTDPTAKFNNEIGRIEEVRFIESHHNNALGKVGTSSVLGEGVVFGEDAVLMAEAMTPELRAQSADFGRSNAVAWYGILEFGHTWRTGNAGEAKCVHVGSL